MERVTGLESRLKTLAVLVSVIALLAPIASAVAAWFSWRTAVASERIAQDTLRSAGAVLSIRPDAMVTGACDEDSDIISIDIALVNSGRTASTVRSVSAELLTDYQLRPADIERGMSVVTTLSELSEPIEVKAQDRAELSLPVNCGYLETIGLKGPSLHFALYRGLIKDPSSFFISVDSAVGGEQRFSVDNWKWSNGT